MKTTNYCKTKMFVAVMLILFLIPNVIKSQTSYLQVGGTSSPFINDNGNLLIGFGNFALQEYAKLHVLSFSLSSQPLFKTEVMSGTSSLASIQHLVTINSINYGIYQTSSSPSLLKNYFQDPVKIGNIEIRKFSSSTAIIAALGDTRYLDFAFANGESTSDPTTPLSINGAGIRVRSNLVTDNFQLLTNPGQGKVLLSDADGNANWTTVSSLSDDDWLPESAPGTGLYLNTNRYDFVGIGTAHPKHKVHVEDGNILLSRRSGVTPGNLSGSILFGDAWEHTTPNGKWGIEYFQGGLNFWKPPTMTDTVGNYYLFIKDNGNVGLNTSNPRAKLEILLNNDTIKTGFILNQTSERMRTNEIQFHRFGEEKWAIGTHINDDHSNSFFIWNALHNIPELFISESGNFGLSTLDPKAKMEILFNDCKKTGLVLNQASDTVGTNEIQFHRNGVEKWAIGCHLNDDHDNSFFIWSRSKNATALLIKQNGMIGINTDDPLAHLDVNGTFMAKAIGVNTHAPNDPNSTWKLNVNGGIWAQEVKVTVEAFPDYVFSTDYPLLSVKDYEKFITENKHLPGLPSSEDVQKDNGIELGKMQVKLLEKVEEQALYIISLQKQIDELKTLIANQKEK